MVHDTGHILTSAKTSYQDKKEQGSHDARRGGLEWYQASQYSQTSAKKQPFPMWTPPQGGFNPCTVSGHLQLHTRPSVHFECPLSRRLS